MAWLCPIDLSLACSGSLKSRSNGAMIHASRFTTSFASWLVLLESIKPKHCTRDLQAALRSKHVLLQRRCSPNIAATSAEQDSGGHFEFSPPLSTSVTVEVGVGIFVSVYRHLAQRLFLACLVSGLFPAIPTSRCDFCVHNIFRSTRKHTPAGHGQRRADSRLQHKGGCARSLLLCLCGIVRLVGPFRSLWKASSSIEQSAAVLLRNPNTLLCTSTSLLSLSPRSSHNLIYSSATSPSRASISPILVHCF